MAKNKSGSFEVTEAAVLAAIVERFHYDDRIGDRLESVVDAQVRARIGPEIDKQVAAAAAKLVADIVKNGWVEAVPYGQPKRHTIEGRVAAFFDEPVPVGGYHSNAKKTRFASIVDEQVEAALRGDLGKILVEARDRFKKTIDDTMVTKLAETLKAALGYR